MKRRVQISIFLFTLIIIVSVVWGEDYKKIHIIFTGNIGRMSPCQDETHPSLNYISKVSEYILEHRDELSPYILIEAGNFAPAGCSDSVIKNLFKAFYLMQYHAVGIMKSERNLDESILVDLIEKYKTPFVSGDFPCKRSLNLRYSDEIGFYISSDSKDISEGAINILLTDMTIAEITKFKGWDIVITSSGEYIEQPLMINGMIILTPASQEKIGILGIEYDNYQGMIKNHSFQWGDVSGLSGDPVLNKLIEGEASLSQEKEE